jgi:structural maintenance of chromosome 3 (chondroitin sulfate proteoglycan 6)
MQQVFGKAIIVPDLAMGAVYARSHGLTAITLQGDKQDKKGALTGGFHDTRRSRLESVKVVKHWKAKYDADHEKHGQTKRAQLRLDQEISGLNGKITVAERRLRQATDARAPLTAEIAATEREIDQNKARLASLTEQQNELTTYISQLKIGIAAQQQELTTPMTGALSEDEADTLNQLAVELQKHKKSLAALAKDRQAVSAGCVSLV